MKKLFLIFLIFASAGVETAFSQIQAGLILGPQIPVGGFSDGFNVGFGFGITGKYSLQENMAVGANLNYNSFKGDRAYLGNNLLYANDWHNKAAITAFTGLFEYYFSTEKLKPYAGADLGFYFWRVKWDYYYDPWINNGGNLVKVHESGSSSGTELGIAPTGGIYYDLSDQLVLNGNLKFNLMLTESNLNYVGINLGLFYKFE